MCVFGSEIKMAFSLYAIFTKLCRYYHRTKFHNKLHMIRVLNMNINYSLIVKISEQFYPEFLVYELNT